MSERFVNIDRETPMLFPVDMRDWLPEDHLVYFIIDAIQEINVSGFKVNRQGTGSEQYPPAMTLALLIYSYVTGRFGSRTIEAGTYTDVAMRYICGDEAHPDHSVICAFRKDNRKAFEEAFTKILLLARQTGKLKKVGGVSVDGSKFLANASRHNAVSYKRAGEIIEELKGEVKELTRLAEEADWKALETGLSIPDEIKRREDRKKALEKARIEMEKMYEAAKEEGVKKKKKLEKYQYNFTDEDSRIMKAGNGDHFEQCYNAQAAVDTEGSLLILGGYVTRNANDKKELEPAVSSVDKEVREIGTVSADSGFYSEGAVKAVEKTNDSGQREGPEVFCAAGKGRHGKTVDDLRNKGPRGRPAANLNAKQKMARKLKTKRGKNIYKKRKETVEPVFGIIKGINTAGRARTKGTMHPTRPLKSGLAFRGKPRDIKPANLRFDVSSFARSCPCIVCTYAHGRDLAPFVNKERNGVSAIHAAWDRKG
jgi:transposase